MTMVQPCHRYRTLRDDDRRTQMKRLHRTLTTCLTLAIAWYAPGTASADSYTTEAGQVKIEPGNSELIRAMESQAERSSGGDQQQPVYWNCGEQFGEETPDDGPVASDIMCDGSLFLLVESPEGDEIMIEKTSLTTEVSQPGPVNYEYEVTSGSSVPLTGITLNDNQVDAPTHLPTDAVVTRSVYVL